MGGGASIITAEAARDRAGRYLTFVLAGDEYGLEILKVHEIIGMAPVTRVPRTPAFIRGVINLRGKVVPVVDLRIKLGVAPAAERAAESCIVVVQLRGALVGVFADRMAEVLTVSEDDIADTPPIGSAIRTDHLLGVSSSNGRVTLLLDIDRVLSIGLT